MVQMRTGQKRQELHCWMRLWNGSLKVSIAGSSIHAAAGTAFFSVDALTALRAGSTSKRRSRASLAYCL